MGLIRVLRFFAAQPFCHHRPSLINSSSIRGFSSAILSPPSKAIVYHQEGSPDHVSRMVHLPPVEIKEKDLCVKMLAAPINPSDINRIQGVYPIRPPAPAIGGYEGVGEVVSVGSSVENFTTGDWVIPSPPSFGTWQTYIVKQEDSWHRVAKTVPPEYAATITVNPLTAYCLLKDFTKLNPGESSEIS